MNERIISAHDTDWDAFANRHAQMDVYGSSIYHCAMAPPGSAPLAFCFGDGVDTLFHPFIMRSVGLVPGLASAETVYGYGCTSSTTVDAAFLRRAWAAWENWCNDAGVVAEFIRGHPLTSSRQLFLGNANITVDRPTVFIDLEVTEDSIWADHQGRHRTAVRLARKSGLVTTISHLSQATTQFHAMYSDTMSRLGARDEYLFPVDALADLSRLEDAAEVIWAELSGEKVAGALILYGERLAHYHLSGATSTGRKLAATNLVLDAAWRRAKMRGKRALHLGGGRTRAADDALLAFKSSISPRQASYWTASRVFSPSLYAQIGEAWLAQTGHQPRSDRALFWQ